MRFTNCSGSEIVVAEKKHRGRAYIRSGIAFARKTGCSCLTCVAVAFLSIGPTLSCDLHTLNGTNSLREVQCRLLNCRCCLLHTYCEMEKNLDLTEILKSANSGEPSAKERLVQVAYDSLKKIATGRMKQQRMNHTLTATALVNEVTLKFLHDSHLPVEDGQQFYAYASTAMRNLLIDHARSKNRAKRGGGTQHLPFNDAIDECERYGAEFVELDEALNELAQIKPRHAKVVEMRYFGGLSNQEIADALGTSLATVKRDWVQAKSWLKCELSGELE